jgi:hypothetical protein
MPLDARKAAHVQSVINKTFSGRQKTVVLVYQSSGTYSYSATSVIFRPQKVVDPQIADAGGGAPKLVSDMIMIAPLGTSFSGLVFVADTATATAVAVQAAAKYEVIEALPVGMIPGGTRIRALLRRLR